MFGFGSMYGGGSMYGEDARFNSYSGAPTRSGYGSFARKSAAATRREQQGKDKLNQIIKNEATQIQILTPGPHVFELLTPDVHLVDASWKDIRKWVASTHGAAGWQLKRRAATDMERKKPGYTRRGKTYFVTAVHKGAKKLKKTKTKKKTTSKKAKTKANTAVLTAAVLAKKTLPSSVFSKVAKDAGDTITVRVKDQGGDETFFKVKKTTKMSKVFGAYAIRRGQTIAALHFLIDGERIDGAETPNSLELENLDQSKLFFNFQIPSTVVSRILEEKNQKMVLL